MADVSGMDFTALESEAIDSLTRIHDRLVASYEQVTAAGAPGLFAGLESMVDDFFSTIDSYSSRFGYADLQVQLRIEEQFQGWVRWLSDFVSLVIQGQPYVSES